MAAILALLLCVIAGLSAQSIPELPQFRPSYLAKGLMKPPEKDLDVAIDVVVYYDGEGDRSRLDYFDEAIQSYQFPNDGPYGFEFVQINDKCYMVNGTKTTPVRLMGALPDLSTFLFKGSESVNGQFVEKYEQINTNIGSLYSDKYTMHVRNQPGESSAIPIRYTIQRVNKLYFVEGDDYSISFFKFDELDTDGDVFKLQFNPDDCKKIKRSDLHARLKQKLEEKLAENEE